MTNDPTTPTRKSPSHTPILQLRTVPVIVFLTICSAKRKRIFADPAASETVLKAWEQATGWQIGRYVMMPDHIHLFCAPIHERVSLRQWVKYWKSLASRRWPNPADQPIWQQDFWDTQMRRGEKYAEKWDYVRSNPVRHGLVATPEEWPYQGESNLLSCG